MNERDEVASDAAGEKNNPSNEAGDARGPDAIEAPRAPEWSQGGRRGISTRSAAGASTPDPLRLSARDALLIERVVCLRLLTYGQIRHLIFPTTDPSISRRRIRRLEQEGWLATWDAPTRSGGFVRYAHPTTHAIRHVLAGAPREEPWATVVQRMLPRTKRSALQLAPRTMPKWLPHQRDVNQIVTGLTMRGARKILWASSWDAPFPSQLGMFTAPQPDYVLVEEDASGAPQLVYGEHDRGTEPVDRFVARKVALYSGLAAFPDACAYHFGVREFRVDVTVIDPVRQAPIARLRTLLDATRRHGGPDIFRFTLGGWLNAYSDAPIWFSVANPPAHDSPALREHTNLTA